jgi:hypothetical protein
MVMINFGKIKDKKIVKKRIFTNCALYSNIKITVVRKKHFEHHILLNMCQEVCCVLQNVEIVLSVGYPSSKIF